VENISRKAVSGSDLSNLAKEALEAAAENDPAFEGLTLEEV